MRLVIIFPRPTLTQYILSPSGSSAPPACDCDCGGSCAQTAEVGAGRIGQGDGPTSRSSLSTCSSCSRSILSGASPNPPDFTEEVSLISSPPALSTLCGERG